MEIVVETTTPIPPATEVKPIKTATMEDEDSSYTVDFYSDNTFKMFGYIPLVSNSIQDIIAQDGIYAIGTYEGSPLRNGKVLLYVKRFLNVDKAQALAQEEYLKTKQSVTIKTTEKDLNDSTLIWEMLIDENTFGITSFLYTPILEESINGETSLEVNIAGDDTEKFKLSYSDLGSSGITATTTTFPATIDIPNPSSHSSIQLISFIDENNNNSKDNNELFVQSRFVPQAGYKNKITVTIKKETVNFVINGNLEDYNNLCFNFSGKDSYWPNIGIVPVNASNFQIYFYTDTASSFDRFVSLFEDKNNNGVRDQDGSNVNNGTNEVGIQPQSTKINIATDGTITATIDLYNSTDFLQEGKKIIAENYPSDSSQFSEEDKQVYYFYRPEEGENITFYIPSGEYIQSLLQKVFPIYDQDRKNTYACQFTNLWETMKYVVEYLQAKGFTVKSFGLTVEEMMQLGLPQ